MRKTEEDSKISVLNNYKNIVAKTWDQNDLGKVEKTGRENLSFEHVILVLLENPTKYSNKMFQDTGEIFPTQNTWKCLENLDGSLIQTLINSST